MSQLSRCRVVLVRTHYPGNLGSTARAMRNFGLSDLVLVDPIARPDDEEAKRLSTHGQSILDRARIVASLGEALADCLCVVGTSARSAGLYREGYHGTPDTVFPSLTHLISVGPIALVFGPEPSGLTNEEISLCHHLVTIPADEQYPVLNLAQSVVICLYELYKLTIPPIRKPIPAPFAAQDRAFAHLREGLSAIHFLFGEKAAPLMHAIRQLIGRAEPTEQEIKLIHGLANQMLFVARQGQRVDPGESISSP